MKKPNIIFIMTDQHRFDALSCMGNPVVKTPNIDQLSEDGMLFNNAYCPSPICGPARAAIFSGIHAGKNGHYTNWVPFNPGVELLTDRLYNQGYYNALVGKLHLSPTRSRHGFDWKMLCDAPYDLYCKDEVEINPYLQYVADQKFDGNLEKVVELANQSESLPIDNLGFWQGKSYLEDKYQITTWIGDASIDFINNWKKQQALFMHISFFGPHHPYATSEPWNSMYDPDDIVLPDTFVIEKDDPIFSTKQTMRDQMSKWSNSAWKKIIAQYYGNISAIDKQVGRIIDSLKQNDLYDNSILVFTADHGDHMGDYGLLGKGDMYDTSVKIPFIVKMPEQHNAGKTMSQVVNSIDLFGTFLDIAQDRNWFKSSNIESTSMLNLLTQKDSNWSNKSFSVMAAYPKSFTSMLRKGNLKLIRHKTKSGINYEAYDTNDEIIDFRNIFNTPTCQQQLAEMKAELDAWTEEQYQRHPLVGGYQSLQTKDKKQV